MARPGGFDWPGLMRLGLGKSEPSSRHVIIIARIHDQTTGLLVANVSDIATVRDSELQPTQDVASAKTQSFIKGVYLIDEAVVRAEQAATDVVGCSAPTSAGSYGRADALGLEEQREHAFGCCRASLEQAQFGVGCEPGAMGKALEESQAARAQGSFGPHVQSGVNRLLQSV